MRVTYTSLGIISLVMTVEGRESSTIGVADLDQQKNAESTQWQFDNENEFVGLRAFQTSNVIRSLSVITMNVTCA